MKTIKNTKNKLLIATLMVLVFVMVAAVFCAQGQMVQALASSETLLSDEKGSENILPIEDDFADDRILVVMDKLSTMRNFSANDFSEIDIKTLTNLTKTSSEALSRQLSGLQTYSTSAKGESRQNKMLINSNNFRTVLCLTLQEPGKENVLNAIKQLEKRSDIISAEPDAILHIETTNPNDQYFRAGDQWGLNGTNGIKAPQAWSMAIGTNAVTVGVIDVGIDAAHPDLADRINTDMSRDFSLAAPHTITTVTDANGHGTHVAGIIGAVGNNSIGITGVAQNVEIISLRIAPTDVGNSFASHLVLAIDYATAEGIHILSNSNGTDNFSGTQASQNAVETAITNFPGLFVTSAGNGDRSNDTNNNRFPSNFRLNNLISVGSLDSDGSKSSFSNWGINNVDIFAPGGNILSTYSRTRCDRGTNVCQNDGTTHVAYGYHRSSGTSMATPFVSGVAALVLSANPDLDGPQLGQQLRNAILNNADWINIKHKSGFLNLGSTTISVRKLNAEAAVRAEATFVTSVSNGQTTITGLTPRGRALTGAITIPETLNGGTVTNIGASAFQGFSGYALSIPSSVTDVGHSAFSRCSSLKNITIPGRVINISMFAFHGCSSLKSITIPVSVKSIGFGAFAGCSALESIVVESGNSFYKSDGHCLREIATNRLIVCWIDGTIDIPTFMLYISNEYEDYNTIAIWLYSEELYLSYGYYMLYEDYCFNEELNGYLIDQFYYYCSMTGSSFGGAEVVGFTTGGQLIDWYTIMPAVGTDIIIQIQPYFV